jgi:hypothetical protein
MIFGQYLPVENHVSNTQINCVGWGFMEILLTTHKLSEYKTMGMGT